MDDIKTLHLLCKLFWSKTLHLLYKLLSFKVKNVHLSKLTKDVFKMNKIIESLGEMFAPVHSKYKEWKAKMDPKISYLHRFFTPEEALSLPLYEARIILYFFVYQNRTADAIANQSIKLSYSQLKGQLTNSDSFYKAIDSLIEKGIIEKVPNKQSMYFFNPHAVSNLSTKQALELKVIKPNAYNTQ